MKANFTTQMKAIARACALVLGLGLFSGNVNAQAPFEGGRTYWVDGIGTDNTAPKDTFVNLMGAYASGAYTASTGILNALTVNGTDVNTTGTVSILLTGAYTGTEATAISVGNASTGGYPSMALSRPVVLRPALGQSFTITTSVAIAANAGLFRFNGVQYFTIDGESTSGQRNLSFVLSASSTQATSKVIDMIPFTNNGCNSISVKNCILRGNSTTAAVNTFAGVYLGGSASTPSNSLRRSQNISVINNMIEAVQAGVYIRGIGTTANNHDLGLNVSNNIIGGTINIGGGSPTTYIGGTNALGNCGILLSAQANATVNGNTIRNNIASAGGFRGIAFSTDGGTLSIDSNITVNANKIYNLFSNAVNNPVYGIRYSNTIAHANPYNIIISNNTIAKLQSTQGGTTPANPNYTIGVSIEDNSANAGIQLYYNSVHLYGDTLNAIGTSACVFLSTTVTGGITMVNNIFANRMGKTITAANSNNSTNYGVVVLAASANPFALINNNNYYITSSRGGNAFVGYSQTRPRVSIAQWRAFTGGDANSLTDIPSFIGNDDSTCAVANGTGSRLGAAGSSSTPVTADINGNTRPGGASNSIGAYQFTANMSLANYPLNGGGSYAINGTNNWPLGTTGSGSFATVSDAVNYLNSFGVAGSGAIRLVLSPGYNKNAEGFIPHIIDFPGAAANRMVSLTIANGYADTIMMPNTANVSNHTAIFRMIGTQYFEINGAASGNARSLTLLVPSAVVNTTVKAVVISPSENSSSSDVTVRNCIILGNSTTTSVLTAAGIYLGHHTPPSGAFASALSGNNNNIRIQNNYVQAVRTGIYLRNLNGAGLQSRNANVIGNVIGGVVPPAGADRTTFIGGLADQAGIYLKGIANSLVDSNIIRNVFPTSTTSNGFRGIDLDNASEANGRDSNITVSKNFIYNLITGGQYCVGIRINLANDTSRMIRVINNSISGIRGTGIGAAPNTSNPTGIFVDATGIVNNYGLEIYHNTINLNGATLTGTNSSYGVFIGANIRGGVKMLNNNISNRLGRASGTGNVFAVFVSAPVANHPFATPNGLINSNNYIVSAPASVNYVGGANAAGNLYAGLANWKLLTLQDQNSVSATVGFTSDTLPDLDPMLSAPLYNVVTPVAGVQGDIYGTSRGVTLTCIGAVEFNQVFQPLTGNQTYLINGTQNPPRLGGTPPYSFSTVNRAFQYLNANGVDNNTGPVSPISLVIAGGYAGEGDTLITSLLAYPKANANRPITLKPDAGRNDTIRTTGGANGAYTQDGSVIRFNGASYFTVDGSNNGSSSRNLTILLPAVATNTTLKVIDFVSTSVANTYLTIKNCNIVGNSTTTAINTFAGIYMGGATTPTNSTVGGNNNNTFENNFIGAVRYGIYLRGNAALGGAQDKNNMIVKNQIGGDFAPAGPNNTNYFGGVNDAAGIFLSAQAQTTLDNNTIKNNIASFTNNRGIELSPVSSTTLSLDSAISITRNTISNISNAGASGGAYGIYMNLGSLAVANQSRRNINVANNMISRIAAPGTAQSPSASALNPYGIFVDVGTTYADLGVNIDFNSINLGIANTMNQANAVSSCIMFNTNVRGGINLRSNILQNRLGRASGVGYAYAVLMGAPTNFNIFSATDYNSYYVNAPGVASNMISATNAGVNHTTSGMLTIANHRAQTGQDLHSINFITPFTSDTNLFIPNSTLSLVWAGGAPVNGVGTDILGTIRDLFTPSIGAHEYLGNYVDSVAPMLINATPPLGLCTSGPYDVVIKVIERTLTSDTLYYTVNGGPEQFVLVSSVNGENRTYSIPSQANNSTISYRVVVRDNSTQQFVGNYPATGYNTISTIFNTFPVANGFDMGSGGWSVEQVSGTGNWVIGQLGGSATNPNLAPQTGTRAAVFPSSTMLNGTTSMLVSPCIDLINVKVPTLRFWVSQNSDLPAIQDRINVKLNGGFGWTSPLVTVARANNSFAFPGYRQVDVCLVNFVGGIYRIGIEAIAGGNGNNIVLDSVIIFDDIQTTAVTPLISNICSANPLSLTLATSSSQYSYSIVNTFTGLPLSSVVTGTGSALNITAPNPNFDSIYLNIQYRNLLTVGQGIECTSLLSDTAKVYTSRFFNGPFAAKGTKFTGAYNNGTSIDPDGAIVGDTLEYDLVAPSGLSYASYGTSWTVTSNQVKTANGTAISNSSYTAPSTSGAGKYTVRPGAIDGDSTFILEVNYRRMPTNCDSLVTRYIKITSAPTVFFSNGRDSVCAGSPLSFTNGSSGTTATLPLTYSWTFGDATGSVLSEPTKTWSTPGQYVVKLETSNNANITRSYQKTITVLPVPVSSFTNGLVCSNDSVSFTNTSTGTGLSYAWAYSLGNVVIGNSNDPNPKAFFATVDTTYNVRLTTTNNVGCTNVFSRTVYVFPRPVASFTTSNHCNGLVLPVTNNSTVPSTKPGNTFGSDWNFGNGTTGLSDNPGYTYPVSGSYVVRLKVTSNFGCVDSTSQPVTVNPKPQAGYTFTNACQTDSIKFVNTTTFSGGLGNVTYNWNLGDNTSSTLAVPAKVYGALGTFSVKLLATESTNGCKDSVTQSITINEKPVAGFTAAGGTNKGCVGTAVAFENGSFGPSGSTLTYAWTFGDGNNSTATAPSHTYTSAGNKPVELTVTAGGCKDVAILNVNIKTPPVVSNTIQSVNNNIMKVVFRANPSGMVKYTWNFGDGATANTFVDSASNTYVSTGTFKVKVTVTDSNGCTGTDSTVSVTILNLGTNDANIAKYGLNVYPNPFTTDATIDFNLIKQSEVSIRVFDMIGRTVAQSDRGSLAQGKQSVSLSDLGFNAQAGAYMIQIRIDDVIITKQLIRQQ